MGKIGRKSYNYLPIIVKNVGKISENQKIANIGLHNTLTSSAEMCLCWLLSGKLPIRPTVWPFFVGQIRECSSKSQRSQRKALKIYIYWNNCWLFETLFIRKPTAKAPLACRRVIANGTADVSSLTGAAAHFHAKR